QKTARAGAEQRQDEIEGQKTLSINQILLLGEPNQPAGGVAQNHAIEGAENALVENDIAEPVLRNLGSVQVEAHKIDRQVDEWKGHAVVAPRLRREQISQVLRHTSRELA